MAGWLGYPLSDPAVLARSQLSDHLSYDSASGGQISSPVSHSTGNEVTLVLSCANYLLFGNSDRPFYRKNQSTSGTLVPPMISAGPDKGTYSVP